VSPSIGIVRIALASLAANKLRTGLTVLGVVIGIGTIIGMLSLINGINQSVMEEFERLGPDVIYVTRDEPGLHLEAGATKARKRIQLDEVEELGRRCGSLEAVSIVAERRSRVAFKASRTGMVSVRGVLADYADAANLPIAEGRFFTAAEDRKSRVCVLGSEIAKTVFGKTRPLGKAVDIEGRSFLVAGVLEETGRVFGSSYDNVAIIPYRAARSIFGEDPRDYVMAVPRSGLARDDVTEEVRTTLRLVRRIAPGEEDGFAVSTQESLLETYNRLTGTIYWVMRIVASIALLVSGVGIMNIMLVAVMERTREIGLRKAVGATRVAIMGQFLVESIALTLMGGIAGIALGLAIRVGVDLGTPLPASVPAWAVPMSLGICCAVGLFFGLYPAFRASGMDPVEALRYE
jgi:putative ABC transport system permease protein